MKVECLTCGEVWSPESLFITTKYKIRNNNTIKQELIFNCKSLGCDGKRFIEVDEVEFKYVRKLENGI